MFFAACNIGNPLKPEEKIFKENSVTIKWSDKSKNIDSISANVKVFSMNNRKLTPMEQTNQYRLVIKTENDKIMTRIDTDSDFAGGLTRSVVSDGNELVIFNTASNEVLSRGILPEKEKSKYDFLTASPITGRINLDVIKEETKRLALDVIDETAEKGTMAINLPGGFMKAPNGEKVLKAKIVFDTVNEVLDEVEITTIPEEGKTVTTTQVSVYEETNGELIKIGCVTTIDTKNENLIEGFPEDYKYYNSIDEIPEISQKKYEELKKNGNIYEDVGMTLGNPADLSNIQTIVEIYDYIDINNVGNEEFRLLSGEQER
jgi:outer membrane lipoprotein-sorting protein